MLKLHDFILFNLQMLYFNHYKFIFFSSLLVKLKSKKERLRSGHTLVEGWRLIIDGLEAKCLLKYVIFSRTEELNNLKPFLPRTGVMIYKIPYKEVQLWSDVETSPGIFGKLIL